MGRLSITAATACLLFGGSSAPTALGSRSALQGVWVPFTASYVTSVDGREVSRGSYQRSADGSTRAEHVGERFRSIAIINLPEKAYFVYREGRVASRSGESAGDWTRQPLALPPQGWRPPQYHHDVDGVPEVVAGIETLRRPMANEGYRSLAPELNWFALITDYGPGQARTEFYNVIRREPDPKVFEPPPGVVPRLLSRPGGIISGQ